MIPHDYGEIPDLHNIGEGAAYVEPDYWADDVDDQLPLLSTVGRGPRGVGLYVGNVKSTSDEVSFGLYSDETGELVWQSPNLAPAQISFKSTDWKDIVPGVAADLDITVAQGGATETYTAYLPAGQPGSLIYLLSVEQTRSKDDTYTVSVDELTIYGKADYPSKPVPRANDIVFFKYKTSGEYGFAFGTIEAVEKGQATFTARTFIPIPPVTIGSNGNWYVDGKDTKVQAKGEKGDKGDKGDTGAKGAQGEKGDKGDKGEQGKAATVSVNSTKQLDPGASAYVTNSGTSNAAKLDFGIPEGKPAKLASLTVKNLEPGEEAYGEAKVHSSNENSYDITLGIPRGEDGKTFDVKNGWWTIDDLPEFDETPINTVYQVKWDDETYHFYIRGRIAYDAELGGPWTVIDFPVCDFWMLTNNPFLRQQVGDETYLLRTKNTATTTESPNYIEPFEICCGDSAETYNIYPGYMGDDGTVTGSFNTSIGIGGMTGLTRSTICTGYMDYASRKNTYMGYTDETKKYVYRLSGLTGSDLGSFLLANVPSGGAASNFYFCGTTIVGNRPAFKTLNVPCCAIGADGTDIEFFYYTSIEETETAVTFIDSLFEEEN